MTQSMTGFSRREADTDFGRLSCEVRTVNHRHLDLSLRLPDECRAIEPQVREAVSARLRRGKVDIGLFLKRGLAAAAPIVLDEAALAELVKAVHMVARASNQAAPPNPVDLLRWPGIVQEGERDLTPLHQAALALLDATLSDLEKARGREGARIASTLLEKADAVSAIMVQVRERLPAVQQGVAERMRARIESFGVEAEPGRLEQELAIVAQKLDVAEELDRLESHLAELRDILNRDEPVGRRLDFLLQEFNREANTLGSKSQDTETTRAAVDLKVLIEQIREQVQNLE